MRARAWHATIAVLVLVGLVVEIVLVAHAHATPHRVQAGVVAGTGPAGRFVRLLSFFTIQSNILCGIVSTQLARDPTRDGTIWRVARLDALFGITVTGIVYSTVLARVHQPHGWEEIVGNTIFHYIVPILMVIGWALFGPRPRIGLSTVIWSLLWPIAWFGYTLVHGAIDGWYPYPFLDVATHGYGRVVVNALVVTLVFLGVAGLYRLGDGALGDAPRRAIPRPRQDARGPVAS